MAGIRLPIAPSTGLDRNGIKRREDITETSWTSTPQVSYALYRDGAILTDYDGSSLSYVDTDVIRGVEYSYKLVLLLNGVEHSRSEAATATLSVTRADRDGDGLIEISSLDQLNAIRYDLNGNGAADNSAYNATYNAIFPALSDGSGCRSGNTCQGYELTTNLDFNDADSYASGSTSMASWAKSDGSSPGWLPIGASYSTSFTGIFDGNQHFLSNLYVDRPSTSRVGLFGYIGTDGVVRKFGLKETEVRGEGVVGGLAAQNSGTVTASYSAGNVRSTGYSSIGRMSAGGLVGRNWGTISESFAVGSASANDNKVGGLVGVNAGTIIASYADVSAAGSGNGVGGLVGQNWDTGTISASFASGRPGDDVPRRFGGLTGQNSGTIIASYFDTEASGQTVVARVNYSPPGIISGSGGHTTAELQSPTGYTGIYANWNLDLDGDGNNDDPWDFGTSSQYPFLKRTVARPPLSFGDAQHYNYYWYQNQHNGRLDLPTATGGVPPLTYTVSPDLPAGLVFDPGYLTIDGIPTETQERVQYAYTVTDANGDTASLSFSILVAPDPTTVAETSPVTVSAASLPIREGGSAATYTVTLDVEPTEDVVITVSSDNGDVTTQPSSLTFTTGNWQTAQTVTVSAGQDDDRVDDTATLSHSASGGNYDGVTVASVTVSVTDDDSDREVLRDFYNATGGQSWTNIGNWLSDRPLGEWHGVTTNGQGQVTHLSLRDNGLSGSLPAALGKMEHLQVLSLDRNNISGSLPSELGNLSNLTRLAMNRNSLSGSIPTELGSLPNLSIIGLARNGLSGSLPTSLGNLSGLTKVSLHDNTALSGALPSGFTDLANLQRLAIANTGLCLPDTAAFDDWLAGVPDKPGIDGLTDCASP